MENLVGISRYSHILELSVIGVVHCTSHPIFAVNSADRNLFLPYRDNLRNYFVNCETVVHHVSETVYAPPLLQESIDQS